MVDAAACLLCGLFEKAALGDIPLSISGKLPANEARVRQRLDSGDES
jgi:hypothetical protein